MQGEPTQQEAAKFLFGEGLHPSDYFLFRTQDEEPWLMARWDGAGMVPVIVEDDTMADLCRMVLLRAGVQRFASVEELKAAKRARVS